MQSDELLKDICSREEEYGLYNVKIDGISFYHFLRRGVRDKVMQLHELGENIKNPSVRKKERLGFLLKSIWQLLWLIASNRKCDTIFRCFDRLEKVDGLFLDKFTDPIIDEVFSNKDYIILEHGRSGRHLTPRKHGNNVIYTEGINLWAWLAMHLKRRSFYDKNAKQLDDLVSSIEKAFPEISWDKNGFITYLTRCYYYRKAYKSLFNKLQAKRLFAPARGSFMDIIPAAKENGMTVFELQHGVTYSETLTYSGYLDPQFTPDYFLTFGRINTPKCYGVSNNQVIEIGWAFENYIKNSIRQQVNSKSVLVISSPTISLAMVRITCYLAKLFPKVTFCFRPHPNEQLDANRRYLLSSLPNISLDDNSESVSVALMRFDYVIGENSTVLYEALAMGKVIGKVCMEGLIPKYLDEEDVNYFHIIKDKETFKQFLNSTNKDKPSKSIYSEFKPELLKKIIESNNDISLC